MTCYIIDDDRLMAECFARALRPVGIADSRIFPDAISAMAAISEAESLPDLILLDVMLAGPNGFTLLDELISYEDTARIPVIVITSLNLAATDLAHYGVRAVLSKETLTPELLQETVRNVRS